MTLPPFSAFIGSPVPDPVTPLCAYTQPVFVALTCTYTHVACTHICVHVFMQDVHMQYRSTDVNPRSMYNIVM